MNRTVEAQAKQIALTKSPSWKKYLFLATAGHFTNDFYNGFLSPLLPIIVANLNLSLASVGVLFSIFSISNSLLQVIAGFIADRLKRNYFVLLGPVLAGGFMGFIGWVNQYWTLLFILCMSGLGTAIFHPQAAALVGGLGTNRKGLAMSIFNTAGAFGVTVGSLIIIPLITTFGLKSTIYTVFLVLVLFLYSFPYLMQEKHIPVAHKEKPDIIKLIKNNGSMVLNLYLMVVIRAMLTLTFAGFVPLYLTSRGETTFFGAIGLAVFQFFSVIGMLLGGHIFDRVGAKKLLIVSFVFVFPLVLLFVNLPTLWGLPFLAAMGFFLSSSTPVNIILGQQVAPESVSFMSSLMMGFGWGVAGLLMTPIGVLADMIGLYWTFLFVSSTSIVGLILVYVMSRSGNELLS